MGFSSPRLASSARCNETEFGDFNGAQRHSNLVTGLEKPYHQWKNRSSGRGGQHEDPSGKCLENPMHSIRIIDVRRSEHRFFRRFFGHSGLNFQEIPQEQNESYPMTLSNNQLLRWVQHDFSAAKRPPFSQKLTMDREVTGMGSKFNKFWGTL